MNARISALALVVLCSLVNGPARAERAVVLVTSENCPIDTMSMLDVRKAYLGWMVRREGHVVRAFRLDNNEGLNRVFFQSVVAMSERTYERRLVSQAMKFGIPRPHEFATVEQLVAEIARSDCAIGYMWREDAEVQPGIKSVRILWQGE